MPAIDPETPRAETAIRAVLDSIQTADSPEPGAGIEETLSSLAAEVEQAQERLDRAASLARNWMGLPDSRISALIGVAATTVSRRDSYRIRGDVTAIIFNSQEGS